ncbi:Poly(A)-specific ribonuclease PARN-like [Camellia lanceoleosa]|uniref:Poly(A)-specific ribonuclease PARN-like n=1 Tax=Camellia lanceoleosa TaxID=1840588 RepID=A0ACC0F4G1_9ERIC|nr:Poly(A)-specific ribonuclease PARN-like [Camellia lanceoleosa]
MKALLNSDSTTISPISPINPRNFTQPKIQTSLHFSPKDNYHHRKARFTAKFVIDSAMIDQLGIPESDFRNPTISTSYRSSKFRKPNQTVLEAQAKVCTGPTQTRPLTEEQAFKVLDTILRSEMPNAINFRLAACFCLPIFQNFKFSKLHVDINEKETFERELQNLEDEQNNRVCGFREVIDLISTSQKPVVAHNSLSDDASESNIHGHDVLRISELFAKLCTILKIAPVTHEDENGHLPSVLEDYTNIFNPCSTSSQDHTIDEDVSVWTDNRRKVDTKDLVFLWGFRGGMSARTLKKLLHDSRDMFSEEFDVRQLDKSEDEESEGIVVQSQYLWEGSDRDYDYEEVDED